LTTISKKTKANQSFIIHNSSFINFLLPHETTPNLSSYRLDQPAIGCRAAAAVNQSLRDPQLVGLARTSSSLSSTGRIVRNMGALLSRLAGDLKKTALFAA